MALIGLLGLLNEPVRIRIAPNIGYKQLKVMDNSKKPGAHKMLIRGGLNS